MPRIDPIVQNFVRQPNSPAQPFAQARVSARPEGSVVHAAEAPSLRAVMSPKTLNNISTYLLIISVRPGQLCARETDYTAAHTQ
jgi:hypothetical protein